MVWQSMPLIPAIKRQKQVDIGEFKASLIYKVQDSQSYRVRPSQTKEGERGHHSELS